MNKDKVIKVPKDTILDGVVIDVVKTTWLQIISPDKINRFENPNDEILVIKYQCKWEDKVLTGEDTYKYYENPFENSKLGSFLTKYEDLKAGIKIKVVYSGEGIPAIKLN